MAETALYDVTNTLATADHGLGLSTGETLMFKPGQTLTAPLSEAEAAELNGHGWSIVPAAVEAEADLNLDSLTVDQLKAFAADNGIDLGEAKLKAEILSAIEAVLAAPAVEG